VSTVGKVAGRQSEVKLMGDCIPVCLCKNEQNDSKARWLKYSRINRWRIIFWKSKRTIQLRIRKNFAGGGAKVARRGEVITSEVRCPASELT
jgi:hypothetical protein